MSKHGILVHGGAGDGTPDDGVSTTMNGIADESYSILDGGGRAVDVALHCITRMEDDGAFNAGAGSCLTSDGTIEMDAGMMNGKTMECGGVGAIKHVRNPIMVAWHVMSGSAHSLVVGGGASEFARSHGIQRHEIAPGRVQLRGLEAAREKYGTVGCVVLDKDGDLAAAVSTGGVWGKTPGRVGDSAIVGAGYYAKNGAGAAVTTGNGDVLMKSCAAKRACDIMESGAAAQAAADLTIRELGCMRGGLGGLITVDYTGRTGVSYNTGMMYHSCRSGRTRS